MACPLVCNICTYRSKVTSELASATELDGTKSGSFPVRAPMDSRPCLDMVASIRPCALCILHEKRQRCNISHLRMLHADALKIWLHAKKTNRLEGWTSKAAALHLHRQTRFRAAARARAGEQRTQQRDETQRKRMHHARTGKKRLSLRHRAGVIE